MSIKNPIIAGLIWTMLISVGLLSLLMLLIQFTSLSEASLPTLTYAIHIISILIGSFIAGLCSGNKGWYYGGITGISYIVFILIIGSILFTSVSLQLASIIQILVGGFIGMVGGIFGVNFSNK